MSIRFAARYLAPAPKRWIRAGRASASSGRALPTACAALLLVGCQATQVHPVGPVPIAPGTAADFTPAVPPTGGPARCEVGESTVFGPGAREVALVREERRITVIVDEGGEPTRYLDVRGDLSEPGGGEGDRTTIGLYLTEGYAVAGNRSAGSGLRIVEIPLPEARVSANLGHPQDTMEQVLSRCGSGGAAR